MFSLQYGENTLLFRASQNWSASSEKRRNTGASETCFSCDTPSDDLTPALAHVISRAETDEVNHSRESFCLASCLSEKPFSYTCIVRNSQHQASVGLLFLSHNLSRFTKAFVLCRCYDSSPTDLKYNTRNFHRNSDYLSVSKSSSNLNRAYHKNHAST